MATMTHDRVSGIVGGHRLRSGLGLAVLSASSFGLSGPLARGLMDAGWSSAAAVAVRVLLAAVVLIPVAVLQLRGRWSLARRNLGLITAYGLVAVAGVQLAFFNAVAQLQVGVALLIEYTAPVAVVGWLWLRHGQRPRWLTALGALVAAAGLVLVLDVISGASLSTAGILWALASMVGAAVYFVLSSQDGNGLPGTVLAAGGLLLGGVALLLAGLTGVVPFAVSSGSVVFDGFSLPWWAPVLGLGVVTAALAYVAGIAATRRLGSRLASFVALFEVMAALAFAWLLLGEIPRALQLLGGVLILAGVVVVKLGETRSARATEVLADRLSAPPGTGTALAGGRASDVLTGRHDNSRQRPHDRERKHGPDQRSNDEQPELPKGLGAGEDRRPDRAGPIH